MGVALVLWTALVGAAAALLGPWLWDNVVVVGRRLWATRHIPEPPGSFFLGHIPTLVASRYKSFRCFAGWSLKWPVYRVRFFFRPVLIVTDPDIYGPLMRHGPHRLPKYTAPYRMFEVFTNPERANILTSPENAEWKAVRRAAVAALTMSNLRLCFPQITAVTQRLIDTLSAAGPSAVHDMDAVAAAITVDVIGLAAFNRDLQATCSLPTPAQPADATQGDTQPPAAAAAAAAAAATPPAPAGLEASGIDSSSTAVGSSTAPPAVAAAGICGSVPFPRGREVLQVISHLVVAMQARNNPVNRWFPWRQAHKDLFKWGGRMSGLVQDLTASMEETPPPPHTLGAHLLKAQYSTGEPLDRHQIMAEIGIMWGAGFETTAHTICWTLFLLATHPEAEAALCAELDGLGLLASPDRPQPAPLQWEHLSQLKYLSAVVNESMRMYPAASSGTIRITDRPITLAGHSLPAGQPVLIPFFAVHRNPRLWQDPDSFRPERFLQTAAGQAAASAPTAAAAPAGAGKQGSGAGELSDDYVDVAADLAADTAAHKDQDQPSSKQQQQQRGELSDKGRPTLELKDPTVDSRGFLPFSIGSRNCVGQALALVELKAVLALLLGSFTFTLHPSMGGFAGVDASARQTVTLRPEHGLLMTLRPRAAAQGGAAAGVGRE